MKQFFCFILSLTITLWAFKSPASVGSARDQLLRYTFAYSGQSKGYQTDSLLVAQHGKVLLEQYDNGYGAENPHPIWSAGKSVANLLLGIAVDENRVRMDDSLCLYLASNDSQHCQIHIKDLIQFTSGLHWSESYLPQDFKTSSALPLNYGTGPQDLTSFVWSQSIAAKPGEVWQYSTGDNVLLMGVLQKALGAADYNSFPWKKLFDKLGMSRVTVERDQKDVYHTGSYIFMRPMDVFKVGQLMLQKGQWSGEQVVSAAWIKQSLEVPSAFIASPKNWDEHGNISGASWWLNEAPGTKIKAPWPSAPHDTIAAIGFRGQFIFVIPSLDAVIVRLGNDQDQSRNLDRDHFLKLAISFLQETQP